MIRYRGAMLILAIVAIGLYGCDDDDDDTVRFTATLTGAAERPNPVTTTATGDATVTDNGGTSMSYQVNVSGIQGVNAAHIHVAAADVAGPIVVNLSPNTTITTGVLASGQFTAANIQALQQGAAPISMDSLRVLMRAGLTYVNVHTATSPGGHIRGQLQLD